MKLAVIAVAAMLTSTTKHAPPVQSSASQSEQKFTQEYLNFSRPEPYQAVQCYVHVRYVNSGIFSGYYVGHDCYTDGFPQWLYFDPMFPVMPVFT